MVLPRSKSPNRTLTLRALEDRDLTAYQRSTELGINVKHARSYLKGVKGEGLVHVVRWEKHGQFGNGPPVPVYALGAGEDAPRPARMTHAERAREYRSHPLRRVERIWRKHEQTVRGA